MLIVALVLGSLALAGIIAIVATPTPPMEPCRRIEPEAYDYVPAANPE